MKTLYESRLITEADIEAFSINKTVKQLANIAVRHVDKIYPIYVLTRVDQKIGEISKETDQVLSIYKELAENCPVDIVFSVYGFDEPKYWKYLRSIDYNMLLAPEKRVNLRIFKHHCTDYNNKTPCPNVVSRIRNACLADFKAKLQSPADEWMYFMEDDMLLHRVVNSVDRKHELAVCDSWKMLLIAFAIWQYFGICSARTLITNSRPIGMIGFPGYNSECHEDTPAELCNVVRINKTRLTNCVLLNVDQMIKYDVKYETEYDCWDDLDMNLQFAVKLKCNTVAIDFPICMETNRPMVGDTSNIVYSTGKLNNYAAQMYYKWGDIIKFRPWKNSAGVTYAINSKLPNDFTPFVMAEFVYLPNYKSGVCSDLQRLVKDDSYLPEFIEKYNVK